jgi:hypothetical protein
MEAHLLRRTARDHGNGGTGLYGLRRHGGAGMGIHDEGKWQLRSFRVKRKKRGRRRRMVGQRSSELGS